MEIRELKEYLRNNDLVSDVLQELGCHHIRYNNTAWTCANPDGDNLKAIYVYDCEQLNVVDYTRDLSKYSNGNSSDIFTLVQYFKHLDFFHALLFVCGTIGITYYYNFNEDKPESLQITKLICDMVDDDGVSDEEEKPLQPIPEQILTYYFNRVNDLFYNDGISYETQKEFEIGYDWSTNYITIPIRDELGNLVGVKGRIFKEQVGEDEMKYLSLEPYPKGKVLYGLYKALPEIHKKGIVYVAEAEKAVMQLYTNGIKNCVATGGKSISQSQIDKLTRLCADIVFIYDKDIPQEEMQRIADKFVGGINIYAVIDKDNILGSKESPTDDYIKFMQLMKNDVVLLKNGTVQESEEIKSVC